MVSVTCLYCGRTQEVFPSVIKQGKGKFCSKICHDDFRADADPIHRFLERVVKTNSCWLWIGKKDAHGYGKIKIHRKEMLAHRFSYTYFKKIELGSLEVHHECKIKACVNPDHLEAVTDLEHPDTLCSINRAKTHCHKGHPFAGANLAHVAGRRVCKICRSAREANAAARRKG